jgi:nucleoside-diphosphate-sugar epimerase
LAQELSALGRCAVTGASGFIGGRLCRALREAGLEVRALGRRQDGPWNEFVNVELPDRLPADALEGCGTLFHLAGRVHALDERSQDDREYRRLNVEGTRHLLELASASAVARVVFFSSVKAMGESTLGSADETLEARPRTAYGRSKLEAERLVLEHGLRTGGHVTCLRLPMVYGPGSKGNLTRMIRAMRRSLFPPLPDLGQLRSIVHVDNVVEAALLAARHGAARGRTYIVCDTRAWSTRELQQAIRMALGRAPARWAVPLPVLRLLALPGDLSLRLTGLRLPFDSAALEKLIGPALYSGERIRRELGFVARYSLADALPRLVSEDGPAPPGSGRAAA